MPDLLPIIDDPTQQWQQACDSHLQERVVSPSPTPSQPETRRERLVRWRERRLRIKRRKLDWRREKRRTGGTWLHFELNITHTCNTVCRWCNRLVGVIKPKDSDIRPDQIPRMVKALKDADIKPYRMKITGGEPAANPHLVEVLNELTAIKTVEDGWVLTNATEQDKRGEMKLPKPYHWHRSPLDTKMHDPFLVSPWDLGIQETTPMTTKCQTQRVCGIAFDRWGFAMCAMAGGLGRLLRINPYSDKPVIKRDKRICKHCIYSLPLQMQRKVNELCYEKEVTHPTPTFRAALKRYREDPVEFPVY